MVPTYSCYGGLKQKRDQLKSFASLYRRMKKPEQTKTSKHEDEVDFISNMPDHILLLILSHIFSTEEVIRTSILSTRWKYLWTAIPSLDMHYCRGKFKKREFQEFVYWVLARKTVDLDRFRLWLNDYDSISTVWRWVHVAVTRNVKEIDLSFGYKEETEAFELPRYLVSCGSLEVLRLNLKNRDLCLPRFVGFPALRVLHLTYVDLQQDDDLVNGFLKSCPLLEDLCLDHCFIADLVCISSPKLKRLSIINWDDVVCHSIKISCPKLVDLDLGGIWEGMFDGNSHVKPLWILLYISCKSIDGACDVALPNLETLVLRTTMEAFTVDELIRILKYCPKLENLKLTIIQYFAEECKWLDEAETRRIWTPDLKKVEFFEFNGERPKVVIDWQEDTLEMFFTWGNKARFSNW